LVLDAGFALYDGNGAWENESTCAFLELDADGLEDPISQYWSIGKPADFIPNKDGKSLTAKKKFSTRCNFAYFLDSLENAGVPKEIIHTLDEDITKLVGMKFAMGNTMRGKKDKTGVPTVDRVIDMPGGGVDVEAEARAAVRAMLAGNGGKMALKAVPGALKGILAGYPADVGAAIRKIVMGKGFLAAGEGWATDGDNLVAK
jgi:hypothetical protein